MSQKNISLKNKYIQLANLVTKNAVVASVLMLASLGSVSASAMQLWAPQEYKPSTLLINPKGNYSSSASKSNSSFSSYSVASSQSTSSAQFTFSSASSQFPVISSSSASFFPPNSSSSVAFSNNSSSFSSSSKQSSIQSSKNNSSNSSTFSSTNSSNSNSSQSSQANWRPIDKTLGLNGRYDGDYFFGETCGINCAIYYNISQSDIPKVAKYPKYSTHIHFQGEIAQFSSGIDVDGITKYINYSLRNLKIISIEQISSSSSSQASLVCLACGVCGECASSSSSSVGTSSSNSVADQIITLNNQEVILDKIGAITYVFRSTDERRTILFFAYTESGGINAKTFDLKTKMKDSKVGDKFIISGKTKLLTDLDVSQTSDFVEISKLEKVSSSTSSATAQNLFISDLHTFYNINMQQSQFQFYAGAMNGVYNSDKDAIVTVSASGPMHFGKSAFTEHCGTPKVLARDTQGNITKFECKISQATLKFKETYLADLNDPNVYKLSLPEQQPYARSFDFDFFLNQEEYNKIINEDDKRPVINVSIGVEGQQTKLSSQSTRIDPL